MNSMKEADKSKDQSFIRVDQKKYSQTVSYIYIQRERERERESWVGLGFMAYQPL